MENTKVTAYNKGMASLNFYCVDLCVCLLGCDIKMFPIEGPGHKKWSGKKLQFREFRS